MVLAPALTHDEYRATRTFPALDGVRAIAVLWVLGSHADETGIAPVDALLQPGRTGVDLFFVLSGFLITTLLLRERPRPKFQALKGFYLRRALRIFPLYYAAIPVFGLVAVAADTPGDVGLFRSFLPALLFYWSDWFMAAHPASLPRFSHAWSLAVEEKFYLVWPAIALRGARVARTVAICTIVAVAAWRVMTMMIWSGGAMEARLYFPFEARFDTMMWGALLATLLHEPASYRLVVRAFARPAVLWPVAVGFVSLVVTLYYPLRFPHRAPLLAYTATPPLVAVLLLTVVTRPCLPGLGLLRALPMAYVGRISYGIYVLHPLCNSLLHTAKQKGVSLPGWLGFPLIVAGSVALAGASYRWFESPLLRLKDRYR